MNENNPFLVIDLEATCSNDGSISSSEMEIIEIGAVLVSSQTWEVYKEFQSFVRPVRNPVLTPFCKELTSITDEMIRDAGTFPVVMAELEGFLLKEECYAWGSWGDYDKNQFLLDSVFHSVPLGLPKEHTNLKKAFSRARRYKRFLGLKKALFLSNLTFEGTHHRALCDARNISRLLPLMGEEVTITAFRNANQSAS